MTGQWQYGQGPAVVKTLVGDVVMRLLMLHSAHDANAAEIMHRCGDTDHAPGF